MFFMRDGEFPQGDPGVREREADEQIRQRILEKLERREEGSFEMMEVASRFPPEQGEMNYNDDLLSLLKGVVSKKQVLDIFAGSQSTRAFFEREGVATSVTSVDITPGRTDLTVSVADLAEHLTPEKQFVCILSLGAHPGFTKFEDIERFLTDDGYFVTGGSHEQFEKFDERFFQGDFSPEAAQSPYGKELIKTAEYFHPVLMVKVNDIRGWYAEYFAQKGLTIRVDQTYVFWKKGAMPS